MIINIMRGGYTFLVVAISMLMSGNAFANDGRLDSLQSFINSAREDSTKVDAMLNLSQYYFGTVPERAIEVAREAERLGRKIEYYKGVAYALKNEGIGFYFRGDYVEALTAWQKSLAVFDSINHQVGVANILSNIGAIYFNEGDYNEALEYYLRSLTAAEKIQDTLRIVTALINIGAVYNDKPATHDKALEYSKRALILSEAAHEADAIATSAINIGEIYLHRGEDEKALEYFQKSLDAMKGTDGTIYAMISVSKVYARQGDFQKSLETLYEALDLARELNAKPNEAYALVAIAQTFTFMKEDAQALKYYKQAAGLAREINALKRLEDAYRGMNKIYRESNHYDSAYKYQGLLADVKDSIYNLETEKLLSNQMFNFQIEKKQNEINLLKKDQELKELAIRKQKVINGLVGAGMLSVAIFLLVVLSQKKKITKEKDRSENLLLNILPFEIAEELKEKGESDPKHFEEVSVIFTDFKGFTGLSQELTARELVQEINHYFKNFDEIVSRYKVEKIKTIGDAYMAVGGLPVPTSDSVKNVILAGIEMQEFVKERQLSDGSPHCKLFSMRLGIHTGPVVAGIVGVKKFQYDIWGDTVNTAARMESSGEINRVNISGATYEKVKHLSEFEFEYRGMVEAKGKGEMEMYFVSLKDSHAQSAKENVRAEAEV